MLVVIIPDFQMANIPFHRLHMQDPIIDPIMVGKNVGYSVNKFEILSVEPFGYPDPLTWESTRLAFASPFAGVCCNFGTRVPTGAITAQFFQRV